MHIVKPHLVLDGSIQSRVTVTVLGLAAEIEREMISLRTTEALAKRKAAGLPLGRPKGSPVARRKLDAKAAETRSYLAKGIGKRSMAITSKRSPTCSRYDPPTSTRFRPVGRHPVGRRNCSRSSSPPDSRCEPLFAANVGSESCLQAVGAKCGLIARDCEPVPQPVGAECGLNTALDCRFGSGHL